MLVEEHATMLKGPWLPHYWKCQIWYLRYFSPAATGFGSISLQTFILV